MRSEIRKAKKEVDVRLEEYQQFGKVLVLEQQVAQLTHELLQKDKELSSTKNERDEAREEHRELSKMQTTLLQKAKDGLFLL